MLKADLKHMRMQIAVDDWDEFESVFNDYQKDLKPIVKRSKRKLYLNEMIELAIKLAGTFSKERKKEIRNSLENIHPYLLREASVTFDPDVVDPGEKWVYAFNRCCELLKIWVQEEIFPESIQK